VGGARRSSLPSTFTALSLAVRARERGGKISTQKELDVQSGRMTLTLTFYEPCPGSIIQATMEKCSSIYIVRFIILEEEQQVTASICTHVVRKSDSTNCLKFHHGQ